MVFLAFGSNLGDRMAYLHTAVHSLAGVGVTVEGVSRVFESPPVGFRDQPPFLNLVVMGRTCEGPLGLLRTLNALELTAGRKRRFPNAPRTLDIDIVLYEGVICRHPDLRIPHPRWKERSFVVLPLKELAPDAVDPETGWRVWEVAGSWPMGPEEIRAVGPLPP